MDLGRLTMVAAAPGHRLRISLDIVSCPVASTANRVCEIMQKFEYIIMRLLTSKGAVIELANE